MRFLFYSIIIMSCMAALLTATSTSFSAELGKAYKAGAGSDSWVGTSHDGIIHVTYGGKYRKGMSVDKLEQEMALPNASGFASPKIDIDPNGNPHIAFQKGRTKSATTSWHTTMRNGSWSEPEKFADAAQTGSDRAYVPDVAADADGNVLACFWNLGNDKIPCAYRWKPADKGWGDIKYLKAHWSSTPKVEEHDGKFYLLYQATGSVWKVAGPANPGETFSGGTSMGSETLKLNVQNEGANFSIASDGSIVAASNIRKAFQGPVGIWASEVKGGQASCEYLGSFDGTVRGDESGFHPNIVCDEATGMIVMVVKNRKDNKAYFAAYENNKWSSYARLYPEGSSNQGQLRCGPSVADIPGPGVVACVNNGSDVYLRLIRPDNSSVNIAAKHMLTAKQKLTDHTAVYNAQGKKLSNNMHASRHFVRLYKNEAQGIGIIR